MKTTYGLIGYPLAHSFSRTYFTGKFAREGSAGRFEYLNFELPSLKDFYSLLNDNPSLAGLNVTIPHKKDIVPLLDELSGEAASVGAVNTLAIQRNPEGKVIKTKGFNTDVTGFLFAFRSYFQPEHRGGLVLGTGGAAAAVCHALRQLHRDAIMVSRNPGQGRLGYTDITRSVLSRYPVVINATPLGTFPNVADAPPFPYEWLGPSNVLLDLVYNPVETRFLQLGKEQGAQTRNGYDMLIAQAEASWKIWSGYRSD